MHPKNQQMKKAKDKTCPDCGEKITLSNPRIDDPGAMADKYGSCVSCYDPTPQQSGDGGSRPSGYEFRYGPNS